MKFIWGIVFAGVVVLAANIVFVYMAVSSSEPVVSSYDQEVR